jgi:hypothetical protein
MEKTRFSGDCPVCNKYNSQTTCTWRDKAFCSDKHRRQYMWEMMAEEGADEDEIWELEEE